MPELHALSVAPQPSREASAGQEGGRRDGPLPPEERVGVLLLNLGGPETLADVEPFLYNLFADDSIIRLPPYGARALHVVPPSRRARMQAVSGPGCRRAPPVETATTA